MTKLLESLYVLQAQDHRCRDEAARQAEKPQEARTLAGARVDRRDACLHTRAANLEEINLFGASITGSGLRPPRRIRRLKSLVIPNSALDDAGLASLGWLTGLTKLYIGGGTYTDAGLANLSSLTGLTDLGMGSATCTDAGLANLAGLTNLRTLDIAGTTDNGRLAGPHRHDEVLAQGDHRRRQVSDEAIEKLHRALPDAEIYINGRQK